MCGIIGYVGKERAVPIILNGLEKLEYRGYDSCGILIISDKKSFIFKKVGKVKELAEEIKDKKIDGNLGVGHTRWATHGGVSEKNTHPHFDCENKIFVVHNGIIENFFELKKDLENKNHKFNSDTDTEVLAHLIEEYLKEMKFKEAVLKALKQIKGTYAFLIGSLEKPNFLIGARKSSPLILGLRENEIFLASDPTPLLKYTNKFIFLDDYDVVFIEDGKFVIYSLLLNKTKEPKIEEINWNVTEVSTSDYEHYMLKEIKEEPKAILQTVAPRVNFLKKEIEFEELEKSKDKLKKIEKIVFVGCGTAYYAGLYGKYLFEDILNLQVDAEISSELRYRNYPFNSKTLLIVISQSGETIDTIEALKKAKEKKVFSLGIINVPGSSLTRLVDVNLLTFAGPELAVASTKALLAQMTVIVLLALYLAKNKKTALPIEKIIYEFKDLPLKIEEILRRENEIEKIAEKIKKFNNFYFLGRKFEYVTALEGALKLKEIAYLHAEAYPAGEMKHGPIALVDENFATIFINPYNSLFEKTKSNLEEIKARKGNVILISDKEENDVFAFFKIPTTIEIFYPFLTIPVLHLLAYFTAKKLGREIDRPRNLAKSVTVE